MKDGEPNGPGVRITANGQLQHGTFTDGLMDGLGLTVYLNVLSLEEQKIAEKEAEETGKPLPELERYEGDFRRGKRHGAGYYCFADGGRYSGFFDMGIQHGSGVYT